MDSINIIKSLKDNLGNKNIGASIIYTSIVKDIPKGGRKDKVTGLYPNELANHVVTKEVHANVKVNHNYESSVSNRAEKVGGDSDFTANSLPWGQWVEGYENVLIAHNDKTYVRLYFGLGFDGVHEVKYFVDGRPATEEEIVAIKASIPEEEGSKKQAESGIALEEQIFPRTLAVENIKVFKCGDYSFSKE